MSNRQRTQGRQENNNARASSQTGQTKLGRRDPSLGNVREKAVFFQSNNQRSEDPEKSAARKAGDSKTASPSQIQGYIRGNGHTEVSDRQEESDPQPLRHESSTEHSTPATSKASEASTIQCAMKTFLRSFIETDRACALECLKKALLTHEMDSVVETLWELCYKERKNGDDDLRDMLAQVFSKEDFIAKLTARNKCQQSHLVSLIRYRGIGTMDHKVVTFVLEILERALLNALMLRRKR
ncbi:MAG: hypothetical protein Q9210_006584 [Variospora velana]